MHPREMATLRGDHRGGTDGLVGACIGAEGVQRDSFVLLESCECKSRDRGAGIMLPAYEHC